MNQCFRTFSKLRKHVPTAVKRKCENSLRSAWTAAIFILIAFRYWQWSGSLTFFSGILSVVSQDLYFGRWMENYYQCMLSCIVGAFFGTLAGFASFNRNIQLTLMFLSMLFLNRVTFFQRMARVIAMLSCFFATLLPDVFDFVTEDVTFGLSMKTVILLIFMPLTITGFCTLIPYPGLALISSVKKLRRILANLKKIVVNVTHSFYDIDNMEVFNAEADILISETKQVVDYVTNLAAFVENEAFVIFPCGDLPALLRHLTVFVSKLLDALLGVQRMLQRTPINLTHLKFAEYLKPSLSEYAKEVQHIIFLIEKLLDHLEMFTMWRRYWVRLFDRTLLFLYPSLSGAYQRAQTEAGMASETSSPISRNESLVDEETYRKKLLAEYAGCARRLGKILNILVNDYAEVRMNFVWHKISHPMRPSNKDNSPLMDDASSHSNMFRIDSKALSSEHEFQVQSDDSDARIFVNLEKHLQSMMRLHNIPVDGNLHLEDDIGKIIDKETDHLSIRNISFRSAYISRLIFVANLVSNIEGIFLLKHVKPSYVEAIKKEYFRFKLYFSTFLTMSLDKSFLESLIQPAKIAGAVTITATFVVYPGLFGIDIEDALWPGITLCFIRQENSASSFLTSYQRLEGNVIGAFYVLFIFYVLSCTGGDNEECTLSYVGPFIVAWIALCCYFREGPMHGYTGVTAAITPIVLLLGPFADNVTTLLFRVTNTILGILIYLAIDIFIFPTRTDTLVRRDVIKCIANTADSVQKSIDAVHHLLFFYECSSVKLNAGTSVSLRNSRASTMVEPVHIETNLPLPANSSHDITDGFGIEGDSKYDIEMRSVGSTTDSVSLPSKGGVLTVRNIDPNDDTFQLELSDGFVACDESLLDCETSLKKAKKIQVDLVMTLKNGIHEPEIFSKPFPLDQYTKLNESFKNLFPSIYGVAAGAQSLRIALLSLVSEQEDVRAYLHMFRFMTDRLFEIARKAVLALRSATEALHRLYEEDHPVVDMSEIISVSRDSDELLMSVDEYFRSDFTRDVNFLSHKNALFAITWMNVFESLLSLVRFLAALGRQLLMVRDVEAFCQ